MKNIVCFNAKSNFQTAKCFKFIINTTSSLIKSMTIDAAEKAILNERATMASE